MEKRTIDTLSLNGGELCLDFINTVHDRTEEDPFDYLSDYEKFLDWSVKVELLTPSERNELESVAGENPKKADEIFYRVGKAREVFYHLFQSIAQNRVPGDDTLASFNALLTEGMSHLNLHIADELSVRQKWKNKSGLDYPLFPIIKSAYDLLISEMPDRIKECDSCGWLFLDQSKNKSRKWCSMESCGSIVKAKRYYHKNKKKKG